MHVFNHKIQFKMFSEEHMVKYIRISLRHPFSVYIFTKDFGKIMFYNNIMR